MGGSSRPPAPETDPGASCFWVLDPSALVGQRIDPQPTNLDLAGSTPAECSHLLLVFRLCRMRSSANRRGHHLPKVDQCRFDSDRALSLVVSDPEVDEGLPCDGRNSR